ncbi:MAG: hypothetical protein D3906_11610, partial [Candidatus Electrothrix sp. AUS1_2]|nr:hypothetical protein [Candidatus Electrothrix sp. AUS1_2]
MSAPIPSFFKMRLIVALVLVFLGFFFIGLINRAFGESFCGSFQITWPPGDQTSREFEVFSTYSQA